MPAAENVAAAVAAGAVVVGVPEREAVVIAATVAFVH